jgi:hypothetical protein
MQTDKHHNGYLESDLSIKLSQLEGAFRLLDNINNHQIDAPRNKTEQQTIRTNLKRVQQARVMYRALINKHRLYDSINSPAVQIASPSLLQQKTNTI